MFSQDVQDFKGYGAGPYAFSTTVQFRPRPSAWDFTSGGKPFFSLYQKSQIDKMMRQQEGPYDIINKTSDANNNLYYIVGGRSPELVNDSLARIRPYIEKFSDINYTLPQAIKEAAGDVGQAAKAVTGFSLEVLWAALKPMTPYIIGGVVVLGVATYTYGKGVKKVRQFALGK